jgi:alkylresorcinol/alkylpyrone synthase
MTRIAAIATALPDHAYPQRTITELLAPMVTSDPVKQAVMRRVHSSTRVDTRHLVLPLEQYRDALTFGQTNDRFVGEATRLAAACMSEALARAGVAPDEVDFVLFTSVTGISAPSVDALVVPLLGMREDVKRMPLFGLGCVAGAAGIARLHDYLVGHPDDTAVLVAVELCSLTVQRDDVSVPNLVASGLFGDGAAAVVARGGTGRGGPAEVLASRSRLYPDSERTMGFDVTGGGLRIVLDAEVPAIVGRYIRGDVDGFLADHGLTRADIGWWVCHPGGPKVIEALQEALEVPRDAVQLTWDSLARIGNLSSASVLHVLEDTLRERPPVPGSYGMVLAMGPGFCSELVLVRATPTGAGTGAPNAGAAR